MELSDLQKLVKSKSFRSTVCGQLFKFIGGNVLQVNEDASAPYEICEQNNWFLLSPNTLLGNEQLIIKVEDLKYPVTITFYKKSDLDFMTTFIEE